MLANLHSKFDKEAQHAQTPSTNYAAVPATQSTSRKTARSESTVADDPRGEKRQRNDRVDHNGNNAWSDPTPQQQSSGDDFAGMQGFALDNMGTGYGQINDLQWQDAFGQVSWEALFQGDGMENGGFGDGLV
jgi:hypothetical protein